MANYQDIDISEYSENPLIDALPKFLNKKEVLSAILKPPAYFTEEREHDELKRDIYTERLDSCIIPNNKFYKAYKKIYKLLLKSYQYRNPLKVTTKQLLNNTASNGIAAPYPEILKTIIAASSFITGLSGMGKSYMIDNILSLLFEQIINHENYKGNNLNIKQLVYVKFNIPSDASRRTLCLNFFKSVDNILGTKYESKNKNRNIPISDLELNMKKVCLLHHIGIVIIDELQNLSLAKSGGAQQIMAFFESLSNEIKVSLLFIGTYDTYDIYSRSFKTARRMAKEGTIDLEQPKEDDPVWNQLVDTLWKFQWVPSPLPMTADIKKVLYKRTQGITFCTVTLLKFANVQAIEEDEDSITEETINQAYKEEFKLFMPALDALREKNYAAYDDLMPLAMRRMLNRKKQHVLSISQDAKNEPEENWDSDDITTSSPSRTSYCSANSEGEKNGTIDKIQRKKRLKESAQEVYNRLESSGFFITNLDSI
ncbi:Transposon Tn7 transposition protein TnsC [invertebrate metagenome]|uniref:Transposon Tn7 transposition protein TnsC n=1 Tax=invertebrate metagenome TaxID=1711999 RepID=A0A2H9T7P8_9ZZZZ